MSVNSIQGPFSGDYKVKLQNRGKKSSGITFELKNVFDELAKQGKLIDLDNKGLTKRDALNLYETLNSIHQNTKRPTNYTTMRVGQEFTYTAEEMNALAKAAGYELVGKSVNNNGNSNTVGDDEDEETVIDGNDERKTIHDNSDNGDKPAVEIAKEKTIAAVKEQGGKVIKRDVDGLKQDIAVYKPSGSKVKIRRTFNAQGELGSSLVATNNFLNNDYVTVKEDPISLSLGEMKLKKVKVDGNKEKEYIVQGKTTDGTNEVQYYKFIPKTGNAKSDRQYNRLGERVYKVGRKYVTSEPETTEKSNKKVLKKTSSKKNKKTAQTPADYDYNADYAQTQRKIAETMNSNMTPEEAIEHVFGIKHKNADKMLKKIKKYIQKHDINTDDGRQGVYAIAAEYGVQPGQLQAFIDSLS